MNEQESTLDDFADSQNQEATQENNSRFWGDIPTDWKLVDGSEIYDVNPNPKPEEEPNTYIEMDALDTVLPWPQYFGTRNTSEYSGKTFTEGDTLFARITPCTENGKAALVPKMDTEVGIGSTEYAVLSPKREIANPWFLYYFSKSYPVHNYAVSRMRGSTGRQRVPFSVFRRELDVALPTLSEQRKIATILYTVDQAIEKTEKIIDRETRIRKGLHQKLFRDWSNETNTDPLAGRYPADWELKTLSDVVTITDAEHFTPDYVESGIPVLRPGDLTPGRISLENVNKRVDEDTYQELINRHTPSNRDIVYSRSQNFAVASQVIEDELFCLGQDMVVIEPNILNETFLLHLLNSPIVRNQAIRRSTGSTFSRVNLGDIRSYKVPIPSEEVQQNIAEIIVGVEEQIRVEQETQSQLNRLKHALMQDLLSGTVRTTDTNITVPDEVAQHG